MAELGSTKVYGDIDIATEARVAGNTVLHTGNVVTVGGTDFAANGILTTTGELDDMTLKAGFYRINVNNMIPGYTYDHYCVQHLGTWTDGGFSVQTAYPFTNGSDNVFFVRKAAGAVWGTWSRVDTNDATIEW